LRIAPVAEFAPGIAILFESAATARADSSTPHLPGQQAVTVATHRAQPRVDWRLLSMALWAAGAAAAFIQMLLAWAGMWRMRRSAAPSPDRQLATQLAREMGISQAVDVLETTEACMPMTFGIVRPAIFLPRDAARWNYHRRRIVLLHELAHVLRADVVTHQLARLALIVNWWNPLAWIAWREFLKERERATDDLVLRYGARASDYAQHLLDVATRMRSAPVLAGAAVAMARRTQLEGRLVAILDPQMNRNTASRASALLAVLVALAMVAPIAAVRAQDPVPQSVPADIDATIRAATAQKNHEMLEKPAEAFEALRQYDNAKKLLDAALAIRADVAGTQSADYGLGLLKLADLEKMRNRPKEAAALYAKAAQVLHDRPESASALIYTGVMKMDREENHQQAIEYFQRAQSLGGIEAGPAEMWMALVREREQNPIEAETLYRSALAVEQPNTDEAATTMELYARFLKDQGRVEEAQSMSDRASSIRKALGAQPSPTKSNALHIGDGVAAPKLLSKVEPEYTEEARVAKYQGTVVLSVEVDPHGIAGNIRIIKGLGFGLGENAVTAIRQWRFQPGIKDGAAVTVEAHIEVNFRLL
jgi:TonB family protein